MADISKLEEQAQLLANNLSGWENSTLQRIGKRIGRYGKMSLLDVKAINNISVVKQDMEAITKELAKVTGYNISQIEQMYGELLEEQHLANQPLYDYRGKTFVPFAERLKERAETEIYEDHEPSEKPIYYKYQMVDVDEIDDLLKEMVGDSNE